MSDDFVALTPSMALAKAAVVAHDARQERLSRKDSVRLADRAQEVADALANAGRLLDELQAEVKARSAIIENLKSEAEEADQRAKDAVRRAALNEQQAQAVDAYLDRALKNRLTRLERSARRREWLIGTVVGLTVGVAAILVAHFLLGL